MRKKSSDCRSLKSRMSGTQRRDVALLLAHGDRRRMLAGAGEPDAVGRTVDFDQPLGAAANRTDLLSERRDIRAGRAFVPHRGQTTVGIIV